MRACAIACLLAGCVFQPPLAGSRDAEPTDSDLPGKDAGENDATIEDPVDASQNDASLDAQLEDAEAADAELADAIEDAGEPIPEIPHLAPTDRATGSDPLVLGSLTIDTTVLTVGAAGLPPGASFDPVPQWPNGPELAVLRVGSLEVTAGATVRAIGTRPLVILASGEVSILGTLDIAGRANTAGAGGHESRTGLGAGDDAVASGAYSDPGGGGAGHAIAGRAGGTAEADTLLGGGGGGEYGDDAITTLDGGSGGGRGRPGGCGRVDGGAGGGALQIYSAVRIMIGMEGAIEAGGGGGLGGLTCVAQNAGAGSGGGSGGAIFLQAPEVDQRGVLAANGGAGGGGGSTTLTGNPGEDGRRDATAALGGEAQGSYGFAGGNGGFAETPPDVGSDAPGILGAGGNAGSGGGAVGRIRILTKMPFTDLGTTSPPASAAIYP
jgi:hypothetical protein